MRSVFAETVLAVFSIGAFMAMLAGAAQQEPTDMWALISVGLFHSIMVPSIFTITGRGLGAPTQGGWLANQLGLQNAFFLAPACAFYVVVFALWGCGSPEAERA